MCLGRLLNPAKKLVMAAFGVPDEAGLRREVDQIIRTEVWAGLDRIRNMPPANSSMAIPQGSVWKDVLVEDLRGEKSQYVLQHIPGTRLLRYGERWVTTGAWRDMPQIIVAPGA